MAYIPDPVDATQPTGDVKASTAAAEFRALKGRTNALAVGNTAVAAAAALSAAAAAASALAAQQLVASVAATFGGVGYFPPVAYGAGLDMTLAAQTVSYLGSTYAPILSALPFTTSGTFETAKFRLIQGVVASDLAASAGSSSVGFIQAGAGAVATTLQVKSRTNVSVEDYISLVEPTQTYAFVRAATYLLSQPNPGGTITVNSAVTVTAGVIDFWSILAAAQGITVSSGYLPNGQLVRGTQLNIAGQGWDKSSVKVVGAGKGFTWGTFTTISVKRAMTGSVSRISFSGDGAVGHTSQVIIAGAQGYSTTTNASAGTTNTNTTCLYFAESVPGTDVKNCRFRFFQEAINQRYGFGFVADCNSIQYCNIAYTFGAGVTSWDVRSGNEIEVCAIGVYSIQTANGRIGPAVIEANLAGCDILLFCSKFFTMDGTWNGEGSPKNVVMRGDVFAPSLPNLEHSFNRLVGLKIDNNGGLKGMRVSHTAIDLNQSFAVNTGERWGDNVFSNCTYVEGPVDLSGFTYSGIATAAGMKVIGPTVGGTEASYTTREPLKRRGITTTNDPAIQPTITVVVPNVTGTCRIVMEATKVDKSGGGYQTQTMRYVGIIKRTAGATADYFNSTNEAVANNYAATGATAPTVVGTPGVIVTGGVGATQTVTIRFATGTPAGGFSTTYWDATMYPDVDGVVFQ